jgi:hypothetical protein
VLCYLGVSEDRRAWHSFLVSPQTRIRRSLHRFPKPGVPSIFPLARQVLLANPAGAPYSSPSLLCQGVTKVCLVAVVL